MDYPSQASEILNNKKYEHLCLFNVVKSNYDDYLDTELILQKLKYEKQQIELSLNFTGINFRTEILPDKIDLSFLKYASLLDDDKNIELAEKLWIICKKENIDILSRSKNLKLLLADYVDENENVNTIVSQLVGNVNCQYIFKILANVLKYNIEDNSLKYFYVNQHINFVNELFNSTTLYNTNLQQLGKHILISDFIEKFGFGQFVLNIQYFDFEFLYENDGKIYLEFAKTCLTTKGGIEWLKNDGCLYTQNEIGKKIIRTISLSTSGTSLNVIIQTIKYFFNHSWYDFLLMYCTNNNIKI